MNALYEHGYQVGIAGYKWHKNRCPAIRTSERPHALRCNIAINRSARLAA